jgi:hypothetical protein
VPLRRNARSSRTATPWRFAAAAISSHDDLRQRGEIVRRRHRAHRHLGTHPRCDAQHSGFASAIEKSRAVDVLHQHRGRRARCERLDARRRQRRVAAAQEVDAGERQCFCAELGVEIDEALVAEDVVGEEARQVGGPAGGARRCSEEAQARIARFGEDPVRRHAQRRDVVTHQRKTVTNKRRSCGRFPGARRADEENRAAVGGDYGSVKHGHAALMQRGGEARTLEHGRNVVEEPFASPPDDDSLLVDRERPRAAVARVAVADHPLASGAVPARFESVCEERRTFDARHISGEVDHDRLRLRPQRRETGQRPVRRDGQTVGCIVIRRRHSPSNL